MNLSSLVFCNELIYPFHTALSLQQIKIDVKEEVKMEWIWLSDLLRTIDWVELVNFLANITQ